MTKRGRGKAHKKRKSPNSPSGRSRDSQAAEASPRKKFGNSAAAASRHGGKSPPYERRTSSGRRLSQHYEKQEHLQGANEQTRTRKDAGKPPSLEHARQQTQSALHSWLQESEELRQRPSSSHELELDPWQQNVFDSLLAGSSVIVDAPTTAGKTRAVEAFFRANLGNPNFRAAYTTPVKSLSNDKLREFRAMFGAENVGIATGDVKENLHAPIVVATLESYRNSLLGVEPDLKRTLVVFDEYHYLQDESRGSAWEEAIILTPPACQILMLSASVANAEQFADWFKKLNPQKPCILVRTEKRPVPLVNVVWYQNEFFLSDALPAYAFKNLDNQRLQLPPRQEDVAQRLAALVSLQLTPCIVYAGRRLACETLAGLISRNLEKLPAAASAAIGESLQASHTETGALSFIHPRLRQMLQVYGVGFHHSGLAPPARMAVEALVKQGLLRFCTATMGLSLGINFSVRSAMITDYQRPGELGYTPYAPSEVLQMLGRAGRRGKDVVGVSLWPHVEAFARLGGAKREPISSRLRSDPTTFLGLVGRGFSRRAIEGFYNKSFQRFTNHRSDFTLCSNSQLEKALSSVPSSSQQACQALLEEKRRSPLAALHLHLHMIGALSPEESLTNFGAIARYFPQAGGLVIAKMIADGKVSPHKITEVAELAAALALARFKEPGYDPQYQPPFSPGQIEDELMRLYPYEVFEEVYDPPFGRRSYPVIREFNPQAAYLIRAWAHGMPWRELTQRTTHEQFGVGDVMSLIYRVGTYLQSIIQADIPELKEPARALRATLLREPLDFALSTS